MDKLQAGSCAEYHANAPQSYFDADQPVEDPAARRATTARQNCVPYAQWVSGVEHAGQVRLSYGGGQQASWRIPRLGAALVAPARGRGPTLLLAPPLAWFVLLYLAALVVLLITAFWQINPFTTNIERVWSLNNFSTIISSPAYRSIIGRTVGIAARGHRDRRGGRLPVRLLHGADRLAAGPDRRSFVAILLPLWASYLAKVYSWLLIFTQGGVQSYSGPERAPDLLATGPCSPSSATCGCRS